MRVPAKNKGQSGLLIVYSNSEACFINLCNADLRLDVWPCALKIIKIYHRKINQ